MKCNYEYAKGRYKTYDTNELDDFIEYVKKVATQNTIIQIFHALHFMPVDPWGALRLERLVDKMEEQKKRFDEVGKDNVLIEMLLQDLERDGINLRPMMVDLEENEKYLYNKATKKEAYIRKKKALNEIQKAALEKEAMKMKGN